MGFRSGLMGGDPLRPAQSAAINPCILLSQQQVTDQPAIRPLRLGLSQSIRLPQTDAGASRCRLAENDLI
jgi:hypothetical protein